MAEALGAAAKLFLVPAPLGMMLLGVLPVQVSGVRPGMGGIVAVAVLLPFVVRLDAIAALAMLTGALAVVHTSDTITSVLIGAPGSAASARRRSRGHPPGPPRGCPPLDHHPPGAKRRAGLGALCAGRDGGTPPGLPL